MKINENKCWDSLPTPTGEVPAPVLVALATYSHHAMISLKKTEIPSEVCIDLCTVFGCSAEYEGSRLRLIGLRGETLDMVWNGAEYRLSEKHSHHVRPLSSTSANDIPDFMANLPVELD